MTTDPHAIDPAHHAPVAPPEPPPAPREVTRFVRRRAWFERHVRIWWLLGLAVLAVTGYYAAVRTWDWNQEARLIRNGKQVDALVLHWEKGGRAPKDKVVKAEDPVLIEYQFNGHTYTDFGVLAGRKAQILTMRTVPIFIDPADPTKWTARTEPASLPHELIAVILLLPIAIALFAMAFVARRGIVRTYRDGEAMLAEVVGIGHSAAAPLQRMVRCAVHVGDDVRLARVLLPPAQSPPVGHPIWLIVPPGRPQFGIPAALFE